MSDGIADRTARDSRRPALYKRVVLGNDRTANLQASADAMDQIRGALSNMGQSIRDAASDL